tara:strand:+ start:2109 stop:6395 length:4287 start_codon:yes stop_codon:yes gene_type:complete
MAQYPSDKKRDVGYKFSAGILSTDADFDWFAEQYGLSPNQLASDIWAQEVPYAASGGADTAISSYSYISKKDVILVSEPNTNDTLWFARVGGTLSGNRMRNFINPNNHTNAAGNISLGYTALIFQSSASGAAGTSVTTTQGSWQFMYKEGAFITDDGYTPSDMGWNTTSTTSGEKILHATVYQYEGINFQPNNNPGSNQVLKYNSSGYLEWGDGGTSGISLTDISVGTEAAADGDGGISWNNSTGVLTYTPPLLSGLDDTNITTPSNGDYLYWDGSDWVNTTGPSDGVDGVSPVALMLSNPVHSLPTTAAGTVTYTGSGTDIKVYSGGTQLDYGSVAGSGDFEVSAAVTTGTVGTIGTASTVGGNIRRFGQHNNMTTNGATITYTITVHHSGGDQTYTALQSLSKQIAGSDGDDKYTWIKYADNADGSSGFADSPIGKDYIGLKFNNTSATESSTASEYTWSLIKGANGSDATVNKTNIENALSSNPLAASAGGTGLSNFSDTDYKNSNVDKTFVDALGIDASTVDGKTVAVNVPSGAVFTDTQLDKSDIDALNVDAGTVDGKTVAVNVPSGALFTDTQLTKSDIDTLNVDAGTVDGKTVAVNVPSGAVFTDTQLTKSDIDALNVDAGTVDGKTVAVNVPSGAVFTDTQLTKSDIDALNVDAGTVDGKTVAVNVPSGALFTDTQLDKAGVEALAIQTVGQLTSGSLGTGFTSITGANIGNLNAGKITSGTFNVDRIPDITANKVTDFDTEVSNNTDVAANTGKTGITTGQADAITANTAKITYDDASVVAGHTTDIAANVAAIATNTAKTGITTAQADAITANTAKITYPTADSDKVGLISVTNSVDLDNISAGASASGTVTGAVQIRGSSSGSFNDVGNDLKYAGGKLTVDKTFCNNMELTYGVISSTAYGGGERFTTLAGADGVEVYLDYDQSASASTSRFRVINGSGTEVFSVDEAGIVRVDKIKDVSGNDKIEYEADKVKIHEDIKAVTGKFKDNSDVTRIDYSGTDIKFSGDTQFTGSSPATIKGPDADKFIMESVEDLEFKVDTGSSAPSKHIFINGSTEVANIDRHGNLNLPTGDLVTGEVRSKEDASLTIKADTDLIFQIDSDTGGTETFQFKNGDGTEVASLDESGNLQIDGDITVSGLDIKNADDEVVITIEADQDIVIGEDIHIGQDNTSTNIVKRKARDTDGDGGNLQLYAGQAKGNNATGGDLQLVAGYGTGTAGGGGFVFMANGVTTSGSGMANPSQAATLSRDGNFYLAGNIELGAASDTTIARSAAGTVTIEDKEIVTKNKIYDFKVSAYYSTYTDTAYSIPFGGTLSETIYLTNNSYSNIYVAPFDGRVVRIVNKEQQSSSGTSELELFLDHSSTKTGSTISVGSFTYKFEEDCPADWTFSKGETIAIKRKDTSYSGATSMTIVFEFDATT